MLYCIIFILYTLLSTIYMYYKSLLKDNLLQYHLLTFTMSIDFTQITDILGCVPIFIIVGIYLSVMY